MSQKFLNLVDTYDTFIPQQKSLFTCIKVLWIYFLCLSQQFYFAIEILYQANTSRIALSFSWRLHYCLQEFSQLAFRANHLRQGLNHSLSICHYTGSWTKQIIW